MWLRVPATRSTAWSLMEGIWGSTRSSPRDSNAEAKSEEIFVVEEDMAVAGCGDRGYDDCSGKG